MREAHTVDALVAGVADAAPREALLAVLGTFSRLDQADARWVDLVELMLRLCRTHRLSAEAWSELSKQRSVSRVVHGLAAEAGAHFDADDLSAFADQRAVVACAAWAESVIDRWPDDEQDVASVLVAHSIARAIDGLYQRSFVEWFRSRISVEVEVDRAYPVARHDPRPLLPGGRANTRPWTLPTRSLDAVDHLALGTAKMAQYSPVISFDAWYHLAPLGALERLVVATLHPNLSLAEFETESDDETATFRNHGPKDGVVQTRVLAAQLEHASQLGASVVVIPEYCVDDQIRVALIEVLERMDRRPILVVAGSSEWSVEHSAVLNRAWLLVPDGPARSYDKVFPAEVSGLAEGIATADSVTVYRTDGWTAGVLVCRDAMAPDLIDTYARLGVNLLAVPAFSQATSTIVGLACGTATSSQAFVAVAVAPAVWTFERVDERPGDSTSRVEAAFHAPYADTARPLEAPGPEVSAGVPGRACGCSMRVHAQRPGTMHRATAMFVND